MFDRILKLALENKRPHGSVGIAKLADALLDIYPNQSSQDNAGNLIVDLRQEGTSTCFMAHLDTVHYEPGVNPVLWGQSIVKTNGTSVLGADDGAGVALLAGLMAAKVPALYMFTQGEETGGHGAKYIRNRTPRVLDGIKRIISWDRKGKWDICGEQSVGVCSSPEYVTELADRLGMGHCWARGTYTDNCEFRNMVPEIVNISVGYENCHTQFETLDLVYLRTMLEKAIAMEWETLAPRRVFGGGYAESI